MSEAQVTPYPQLPGLDGYYFEDSYVLGIHLAPEAIMFDLLAVLTPGHSQYRAPGPSEQHCYRRARLSFANPSRFTIASTGAVIPATDAAGDRDFGHIDSLLLVDGRYRVEGEWGSIDVESEPPIVVLLSSDIPGP